MLWGDNFQYFLQSLVHKEKESAGRLEFHKEIGSGKCEKNSMLGAIKVVLKLT